VNTLKNILPLLILLFLQACTFTKPDANTASETDICAATSNNCTFVVFSESSDKLLIINEARARQAFTPASTFKIANSLIALETSTITDAKQILAIDYELYPIEDWWQSSWSSERHDLRSAFQNSVLPIYRGIASQIGAPRMSEYLARFNYGNQDITSGIDYFWVNGSLKISALEQIRFLQNIYHNEYSLQEESLQTLKEIMLADDTGAYKLYAKTGAALIDEGTVIAWYVGFIENQDGVHYFAFNLQAPPSPETALARTQLPLNYLTQAGII
tara:strand:- start:46662 stop:47480 length:819 start_codon:yes stop_codon:yes gene_type:complete